MPRRSLPWYRKGRQMFCSTIEGKQVVLVRGDNTSENRALAEAKHRELIEAAARAAADEAVKRLAPAQAVAGIVPATLAAAASRFVAATDRRHAAGKLADNTAASYRCIAGHIAAAFGGRVPDSMAAEELELWADRPAWSPSYQAAVLWVAQQVLKLAGVALDPPIARPSIESRGADTVLSDEQFERLLADVERNGQQSADLGQLLRVLRETGARPAEVSGLTAEMIDWPNKCARIKKHKTKRKTGRDRILYFTDAVLQVLDTQHKRYGSGVLFRTRYGRRYSATAIVQRLSKASKRLGFRAIAYGLGRHSFATAALEAGVSDTLVAGLLGHSGTNMLHKHYSHVTENARAMRGAAEQARGRAG